MKNKLYYGDNIDILRKSVKDESVDLCYIDPPFNSKRNYNQIYNNIGKDDKAQSIAFVDTWEWNTAAEAGLQEIMTNSRGILPAQAITFTVGLQKMLSKGSLLAYLVSMTLRIAEIHRVLKPTGSFYLHCDPTASHYLKLVLDSIFCSQGGDFINEIVWCYGIGGRVSKRAYGRRHDTLFFYTKSDSYTFNYDDILDEWSEMGKAKFKYEDEKGRYRLIGRFLKDSPIKGHRDVSSKWEINHPELVQRYYMKAGKSQVDWWNIPPINQVAKERLGYPTQKPEALLERIIKASSNEGHVVLDAFCGCGTTVAVAQKLKRQWIGIDITYQSISLILKRLTDTNGPDIIKDITVSGVPVDRESAIALANRTDDKTRKEFEKWAVLTYSNTRALINEKRGGDGGIDGCVYILDSGNEYREILFSVKSNKVVNPGMVRDLRGTVERENAAAGIFITLNPPTKEMIKEAVAAGTYKNEILGKPIERIKIITIDEILAGERLTMPLVVDVVKKAKGLAGEQLNLPI